MHHPIRLAMIPLTVGVLLLTACGSDSSSADSSPSDTAVAAPAGDFNDADVAFAQGMIPHHQQAVEMAEIALASEAAASAEVQALATQIKGAQDPEIELMTAWLVAWDKPVEMDGMDGMDDMEGMEGMEGMMSDEDIASLATLTGAEFDTAWTTMMIAHHQGAITQAQTAKASASNADVLLLADQIIAAQQAEIDEMQGLLAG